MALLFFLRWLRGAVHFSAEGGFSERFLDFCRKNSIELWGVELRHGVLYSFVAANDYRSLRKAARKSGMHLRVCKKIGLPFFLQKQKKHSGLAVGLCLFAALLGVLSTRVWVIGVTGNTLTETRVLLEQLEAYGVRIGMRGNGLDVPAVSKEMLDAMQQLDWIALNLRGSELEVLVREHPPESRKEEPTKTAQLVAAHDGRLVEQRVYAGTRALPEGSAFRKGDVLIYGYTKNVDETNSPIRARGYIVAETERLLLCQQKLDSDSLRREKLKKQYALRIFGLRLPLYFRAWESAWESTQYLSVRDVVLPLGVQTRSLPMESQENQPLTEQQSELLALQSLHAQADELLEYKNVRSLKTELKNNNGVVTLSVRYLLYESIGQTLELE